MEDTNYYLSKNNTNQVFSFDELYKSHINSMNRIMNNFNKNIVFNDISQNFIKEDFIEENGKYVFRMNLSKEMRDTVKLTEKNGIININAQLYVERTDTSKKNSVYKSTSLKSIQKSIKLPIDSDRQKILVTVDKKYN
jgi:HSP20 family molecular chaperone IbpA